MWYWVVKLEGMLFIPFIPLFIAYYTLRGIPFFIRCRKCRRWLILDPRTFRFGMCEKCHREMVEYDVIKFHQLPEIYEGVVAPASVAPAFDPFFRRMVKRVGDGRVLEVGCACGYLLSKLNLQPELLHGLDVAPGGIKIASNWVKGANFYLADARSLPFKSNTFDYLLCTEVLEHVEGDDAVKECYRVLKPGGVALITVPNGKGIAGRYFCAHVQFFTFESITNLLEAAGFEIVSGQKFGLYMPFLTSSVGLLSNVLGRNLPFSSITYRLRVPEFLAMNFFIECRKPANKVGQDNVVLAREGGVIMLPDKVSTARWLAAQEQERKGIESAEDMKEWLRVRRHTWRSLLELLKGEIAFDSSKRILDIGGGPTSIFLALRGGEKYAVDPNFERLFDLHPFMREVEEYKHVNFISSLIEEAALDKQFDLIFMINMLDHVGALKPVMDKVNELLVSSGILVIIVDCYADRAVRNIMSFFDIDLPHPHHFVTPDIIRLLPDYKLKKQDNKVREIFTDCTFRGKRREIEIYRVDKFIALMRKILKDEGKGRDILFISQYVLCYSLAMLIALLRRQEKPIYPLKKPRLFVFQKQ
jgi:2-polyprenyl-3-methyl-5-hydroxy-6-metoxy-1,4-benzoquinol methylase